MRYLFIITTALFIGYHVNGQHATVEALKAYYKDQNGDGCLKIYNEGNPETPHIILIRHGKPALNKKGWRGRHAAAQYAAAYDTVGVEAFDNTIHCLEGISTGKAYHSTLPRSSHTAQLLFGDKLELIENARFREFERKVMKFVNLKMPLVFWLGTSRVLWLMNLNDKGIETFKQAKVRANENALFLAEEAKNDGQVIVVAHGLHNKYVMKYLRKNGWKKVRNGGSKYLAVNVLVKGA